MSLYKSKQKLVNLIQSNLIHPAGSVLLDINSTPPAEFVDESIHGQRDVLAEEGVHAMAQDQGIALAQYEEANAHIEATSTICSKSNFVHTCTDWLLIDHTDLIMVKLT